MAKAPADLTRFSGWNQYQFDLVVAQSTIVLPQDARRAGIIFSIGWQQPWGGGQMFRVSPMIPATDYQGFPLTPENPILVLDWQQYGPLLGQQWWAWEGPIGPIGGNYLNVAYWYFDPVPYRSPSDVSSRPPDSSQSPDSGKDLH